ncbi:MAG: fluoride efflux transporter CrcB [Candidatus Cloacimonadota bacterium]|nr:fluoride efflux transporter CrcB [Candidatus Cloacimonadota bacterium]
MIHLKNIIFVGLGGFVGSILRYLMTNWIIQISGVKLFPIGTSFVNILGCLMIGILGGWYEHMQFFTPHIRLFLMVGLLGGFTTFSSFGYETMNLVRDKELLLAFTNFAVQIIIGFSSVLIGIRISALIANH